MRKFFVLFAVLFFTFTSCKQAEDPAPEDPPVEQPAGSYFVRDSSWSEINSMKLYAVLFSSRGIESRAVRADTIPTEEEAKEAVEAYNAAHTDDQWFFLEEDVPVEQADDAEAWIVRSSTLAVYWHDTVSRADLAARRDAWRLQVETTVDPVTLMIVPCTLYVDNLPPEPPVVVPPTPKLWTSILDLTDYTSCYTELAVDEAGANFRYTMLTLQLEAIKNGDDADHPAGHDYIIYRGDHSPTLADFPI